MRRLPYIDSHTGGEPTRLLLDAPADLREGPLSLRRDRFRDHHDALRSAAVCEPRGNDVLVGAVLVPPHEPGCAAGVIFFNNVGTLSMCGHGLIGVVVSLGHAGRLRAGTHRIDTPAGVVVATYDGANRVTIENVPSYRLLKSVPAYLPCHGPVHGDVAWGGNWFFLVEDHGQRIEFDNVEKLTAFARSLKDVLASQGITGEGGAEIDHVELFGPPSSPLVADSRNFVLCPGNAYDRSPCGTGTSAKLACLVADGKLAEGGVWRQESIVGSVFTCTAKRSGDAVVPTLTGEAWVTAEGALVLDERDPFCYGIRE